MINALIVDDERLVRKGFIAAIPWESYGVEIIGEAANGKRALEFLEENQTDLLITDLSMPIMSGFELMDVVRERFPSLIVAVLTCHQDFKYIQDALRLGAIDYILKTDLDNGALEEAVVRVVNRVMQMTGNQQSLQVKRSIELENVREGYWICCDLPHGDCLDFSEGTLSGVPVMELKNEGWFVPVDLEEANAEVIDWRPKSYPGWFVVKIERLFASRIEELSNLLQQYRQTVLFYDYERLKRFYVFNASGLLSTEMEEKGLNYIEQDWLAAAWIFDEELFGKLLDEVHRYKLTSLQLKKLFYRIFNRLEGIVPDLHQTGWFERFENLPYWTDWKEQLSQLRKILASTLKSKDFTETIVSAIFRSVDMLNEDIGVGLNQEILARKVNLSRGYFSYCFKEIVGKPFKVYLKELRIEAAKRFLAQSQDSVADIAEKVGFQDQRYFSRVFFEETGLQPREYRLSIRQSK